MIGNVSGGNGNVVIDAVFNYKFFSQSRIPANRRRYARIHIAESELRLHNSSGRSRLTHKNTRSGGVAMARQAGREELTELVKEIALSLGACAAGIATKETLEGGPPSTDLGFVLEGAKSAVSFALPLEQAFIDPFFRKEDHRSHYHDNIRTNVRASGIALEISNFLEQKGFASKPLTANLAYRSDTPNGKYDELPLLSHRYVAVRSGVGYFGLSGNVLRAQEGAAIILGSVVTAADLIPTDALPAEGNYCDKCRLCLASCASGFMNEKETVTVAMGGKEFSYSRRRHHTRCDYVCGGFTGLHKSGKWSTWSPGRFPIPEKDEEFLPAIAKALKPYLKRPAEKLVFNVLMPGSRVELTCGNCQLICHPDREIRRARHKMLVGSGVVVQNDDGTRIAVTPEEAKRRIAAMDPATRALYEEG
jgi:epoxyqueuosine reductase QueG